MIATISWLQGCNALSQVLVMAPKRQGAEVPLGFIGVPVLWYFAIYLQVLAEELEALKRRRAELRASNRALTRQAKNLQKRRTRLLQAGVSPTASCCFSACISSLCCEAARQLSQEDLVLLLRQAQNPPGRVLACNAAFVKIKEFLSFFRCWCRCPCSCSSWGRGQWCCQPSSQSSCTSCRWCCQPSCTSSCQRSCRHCWRWSM